MPKPITKIQSGDNALDRVQDKLLPAINALLSIPTLNGQLIETLPDAQGNEQPLQLTTSFLNVPHRLGRVARWQVISPNADARVWEDQTPATAALLAAGTCNPDPTKFLRLKASATVTLMLWVF